MTMDERSDVSNDSDDQETGFSFDFNDDGLERTLANRKTHAWNFDAAREGLRKRAEPRKTVDDIVKKQIRSSRAKQAKASSDDSDESAMDVDEGSDSDVENGSDVSDSGSENGSEGSSDSEQDSDASQDGSGDESEGSGGSEDEEDILIGGDDDGVTDKEHKRAETESKKELRDITRKVSKKHLDLLGQLEENSSFDRLKLSRPLLKALNEMGFEKPTPVQMNCIPPALKGRDICASATTGSGKTAAFILPILERLLYRNTHAAVTRVLILMPTRELAVQCHSVIMNLAKYSNGINAALVTGGMSVKKQEMDLRSRPDIIVATPGRVLDHLLNTRAFDLGDIEILVLDEADRLLELGFMEQLEQVVKSCPASRQTLLFSATMTDRVDQLASLSLKNPARLTVDPMFQVARKLTQEFVRVRSGSERDKEAILLSLCTRTFTSKVIIFCTHKRTAHRLKIIFLLAELKAAELHGDLTQEQRFDSLENFRDGKADFLIASDVASRGLDVIGVETVINFELPLHLSSYVHRVGRTARAGRSGRAVSLVTEADRRLFKMIVKNSHDTVQQRIVPPKSLATWSEKINGWESNISQVLQEEHEDKLLRLAEMEATRASNLIEHRDEIMSRPKKTWFQNEGEKKALLQESKRAYLGGAKFSIEGEGDENSGDDHGNQDSKKKKRKREDQAEAPSHKLNLYMESKKAKKRKLTEDDRKELKSQAALMRQKRREREGREAPTTDPNAVRISGTAKTHSIKLKNKASNKKSKSSAAPSNGGKREFRDKGKSLFGAEVRTASFGKKKGGFKSKSRHKRR